MALPGSETERLPDVVAVVDGRDGVKLERQRALTRLPSEHPVEQPASALGPRKRRRHAVAPRLTDAALQVEVSGGVSDRGAADVQRSGSSRCRPRHERAQVHVWIGERGGIGRDLRRDEAE